MKRQIGQIVVVFFVWLAAMLVCVSLGFIVSLVIAWPFMWLWNASAAVAFGLQPIGYWTSVWLLVLLSAMLPKNLSANKG